MNRVRPLLLPSFVLLLLAGLVLPLAADEPETPPRRTLPVALEDVELLPIREIEWAWLMREHPALVRRLTFLGGRLEKIHRHLQEREDPTDAGSRKLGQEVVRAANALGPHLDRLLGIVEGLGVDAEVLAALDLAPKGPKRAERYALRIVGAVPDASPEARALYRQLVPAVDAALLSLETTRRRHAGDPDLAALLATEMRSVQKRFWRVVDSTLDRDQRIWVRRRLPTSVSKVADLFGHLYTLPDLSASQAARLLAILVRIDAEAAPDKALAARTIDPQERQEAEARNAERFLDAWEEGRAVLNEDQQGALDSILPMLTPQDRPGDLEVLVGEIELTEAQGRALADLYRRFAPVYEHLTRELARIARLEERMAADDPERDAMGVEKAQAYGAALREARRAASELFLEVLTPEQVTMWVLGVPKGAKD